MPKQVTNATLMGLIVLGKVYLKIVYIKERCPFFFHIASEHAQDSYILVIDRIYYTVRIYANSKVRQPAPPTYPL